LLPLDPTRSSPAPSANRLPVLPHLFTTAKKKLGEKMKKAFFLPLPVPGPLRPSTVFVPNNSAFQVDRGVSEGFSAELARDRTWWGKGTSIVQD
jgi:hypothetical protein